jgi:hypothetical protein
MRARARTVNLVPVQVWGPEPIGASMIDSLDTLQGVQLSGAGVIPAWGIAGSQENTSQSIYVSPQLFAGMGGKVSPSLPDPVALPATTAPGGFYGL